METGGTRELPASDAKQNKTKEKEKTIAYYFMAILDQTTRELLRNRESLIFLFKYFNEVN